MYLEWRRVARLGIGIGEHAWTVAAEDLLHPNAQSQHRETQPEVLDREDRLSVAHANAPVGVWRRSGPQDVLGEASQVEVDPGGEPPPLRRRQFAELDLIARPRIAVPALLQL